MANNFTSISSITTPGFVYLKSLLDSSTLQGDITTAQGDITTLQSDLTNRTTFWYYTLAADGANPIPSTAVIGDQASSTNGIWSYQSFSTGSDISNTSGEFTFTTTGVYEFYIFLRLFQSSGGNAEIELHPQINSVTQQCVKHTLGSNKENYIHSTMVASVTAGDVLRFYQNEVNTQISIVITDTNDANLVIKRLA